MVANTKGTVVAIIRRLTIFCPPSVGGLPVNLHNGFPNFGSPASPLAGLRDQQLPCAQVARLFSHNPEKSEIFPGFRHGLEGIAVEAEVPSGFSQLLIIVAVDGKDLGIAAAIAGNDGLTR
jgi:hypothetical protein